jgi:hypothetical protein
LRWLVMFGLALTCLPVLVLRAILQARKPNASG